MRGGAFHEWMIDVLDEEFRRIGLHTKRQVPSRKGRTAGYIDLLVCGRDGRLLVVEIEMSSKRIQGDVRKRRDLGDKAALWVVVPTQALVRPIDEHLRSLRAEERKKIFVLSFGAARKRLLTKDPFCFEA